jgi:hypothetical protein
MMSMQGDVGGSHMSRRWCGVLLVLASVARADPTPVKEVKRTLIFDPTNHPACGTRKTQ